MLHSVRIFTLVFLLAVPGHTFRSSFFPGRERREKANWKDIVTVGKKSSSIATRNHFSFNYILRSGIQIDVLRLYEYGVPIVYYLLKLNIKYHYGPLRIPHSWFSGAELIYTCNLIYSENIHTRFHKKGIFLSFGTNTANEASDLFLPSVSLHS